jgi:glycosyltransferase involved in cell wall biosynthesis
MILSIIIPALNEEKYLPQLLKSIKEQDFKDYEIIVAEAGSEDKTLEIAEKNNCRVVKGGLPGEGRNKGAEAAQGDLLLFLDADIVLPENFFNKVLEEFNQRELDIATFRLFSNQKSKIIDFLFSFFYNFPIILTERFLAHAAMGILIRKELFKKINGFDEGVKFMEDSDLARRAKKIGKFGVIRSSMILISIRRFQTDGWLSTYFKSLIGEIYTIFLGPIKSDIIKYQFNHYSKNKKNVV